MTHEYRLPPVLWLMCLALDKHVAVKVVFCFDLEGLDFSEAA